MTKRKTSTYIYIIFLQETDQHWDFRELGVSGKVESRNMTKGISDIGVKQFLPVDRIMDMLGHRGRWIDYVKIDVEGDEWGVSILVV